MHPLGVERLHDVESPRVAEEENERGNDCVKTMNYDWVEDQVDTQQVRLVGGLWEGDRMKEPSEVAFTAAATQMQMGKRRDDVSHVTSDNQAIS